jgi:hypothetical protein
MNAINTKLRRNINAFIALLMFASGLQFVSLANAPFANAAPASTSVAGNISSGGLEFNNARYYISGGAGLPVGEFTAQMWVQLDVGEVAVPDGGNHDSNYLMGGAQCNDFGIHSDYNQVQNSVRKSVWVIDYFCGTENFFYCDPISSQTWYGLVFTQSTTGFTLWMNGKRCSTNFDGSGSGYKPQITFGSPDYIGGGQNQIANRWSISNFRWENYAHYDVTQSTITPDSFPLAQTANTKFLLNSNVPGNSTDATGNKDLMKGGTGQIRAAPTFLTAQSINLTSSSLSLSYGQTATLTPSGYSGTGARTYNTSGGCTVSGNTLTAGPSGTCTVSVTIAADTTYKAATSSNVTITQSKANQATFTASQATSSATWNGSAFTATPSFSTTGGSDTGAVTYGVTNGTATGCALSNATASAVLTASTAGTCTITATKAATTNYNVATSTLTFTFSQVTTTSTLAISNSSVTYGSAVTLTATVSPSTASGTFSFSNNGTPISGCTSAAITSGIATCTTWKPGVGTYTPITATYSGATNVVTSTSSNSISLQVSQATLTVTASSPTVIYGAAIPTIAPSYSGFVNSETSAVVTGLSCSTVYTTTSAVGSLPATSCSGGSASNYAISYVSGSVTISQSTPTISLALPASATTATYGTAVTITATVSKPGAVTFKVSGVAITGCTAIAATTTATCSWTTSAANATTALTADFTPTDSTNYANLTGAGLLTINVGKASLSITASSHTVAFGSAIPTITAIYSGLVNGDSSAVVTGLTCTTTYTTSTSVGTTGSSCSGGSASNYTISYTSGLITITQGGQTSALVVTSTTATYESTLSLLTSGGNGAGSNSFVVDSGPCTVLGSTLTPTGAGICMVTATKAANGNYLAASSTSTAITIAKATPTFSWSGVTKTYGAASFPLTTPTSSTPGDWTYSSATTSVASISGSTATVAGYGTSLVTATFTPTDLSNYLSGGTTTMTILVSKASLGITASSHTVAYGGAVPTITPIYSGFVNGEDSTVISGITCSTTYTTTTAVGTAASSCTGATASNYSITYTVGVITITQGGQTSVLVITSTTVVYGSSLSLVTSGGSGAGSNSFMVDSGPCSITGTSLSGTAAGICMVTATKAANGNYIAANSVSTAITVTQKNLTITGITGVNKTYDAGLVGAVTGTPTLVGTVNSDNVLLAGTPTFTFASANVGNGISVAASGYLLTGSTAGNYTLTQPSVTANITQKEARVIASNVTVAFGATVTSGFTTSGFISPDAVSTTAYTYTGAGSTGTSTPPTGEGSYTIMPTNAVMATGSINNYSITYDSGTLTILARYTITLNANGGVVSGSSTSNVYYVVGDVGLTLPTPTRTNFTFIGWFSLQSNGVQITGVYTPTASSTIWARWVQNSLYGMGENTKIFSLTTLSGIGNYYQVDAAGGTVSIQYLANALPAGTIIDAYLLTDTSTATTLIGANNTHVMSLVLAWLATDGTVPTTAANKAIIMTISNSAIRKGAKIYSVIGENMTMLGTATVDGSAVISITDDPQIIIAITRPEAPTGVTATSGSNASSTVFWTAPSNDGGSAITSYTAVSNTGQSCTTATTSCQVTGLSNGTSYTFTVTAANAIGVSDVSSASAAATPSAPAPISVSVSVPVSTPAPIVVATQNVVSTPSTAVIPTITSVTFIENAAKNGGKLVWVGTNIESVLFTGDASIYPQPFNYGAFTLTWSGELVNMVAGVTYTMKIEARSSTGGSESKTIEYTIAKPVIDSSAADAALKAAQEKAAAEKKAADEAAALKVAQEKALADAKAAEEAAALKIAQDKAAAEVKAAEAKAAEEAAALKIAQDKAAAEVKAAEAKAAEEAAALKIAQDKAAAEVKAAEAKAAEEAAALKIAQEKAAADAAALVLAKKIPALNLFTSSLTAKYTASQATKLKKLTLKLEPAMTLKCVGYINIKGTTAAKAKEMAFAKAKATCAIAKKLNPAIKTVVATAAISKAPKPLIGASNTKAKYRVDLFAYRN